MWIIILAYSYLEGTWWALVPGYAVISQIAIHVVCCCVFSPPTVAHASFPARKLSWQLALRLKQTNFSDWPCSINLFTIINIVMQAVMNDIWKESDVRLVWTVLRFLECSHDCSCLIEKWFFWSVSFRVFSRVPALANLHHWPVSETDKK